jgi:hypothetical protein
VRQLLFLDDAPLAQWRRKAAHGVQARTMIAVGDIGPWSSAIADAERAVRCRELRALALVYLGSAHSLTVALGDASADPAALE